MRSADLYCGAFNVAYVRSRRLSDVSSERAMRARQFHQLDERERVSAGLVAIARALNAFYSHFA